MSSNSRNKSISQYVADVVSFSSQYTSSNGAARNIIGPPKCLNKYGDNALAWCPARFNRPEYIEIKFEKEVFVEIIRIYENLNGGCVVKIETLKNGLKYECVWKRSHSEIKKSYNVFEAKIEPKTNFRSNQLKIHLDCAGLRYYTQLDAIQMTGCFTNRLLPDPVLKTHLLNLLKSEEFSDIEIFLQHGSSLRLHKSILLARCLPLLSHLDQNDGLLPYLDYDEFRLVAEFIYTSCFDFDSFERLMESNKAKLGEWFLIPSKLIRFAVRFGIHELAEIITEHMVDNYLSMESFAQILIDSNNDEFQLVLVQAECLKFIRENLGEVIKSGKLQIFSKDILLKIITNCI